MADRISYREFKDELLLRIAVATNGETNKFINPQDAAQQIGEKYSPTWVMSAAKELSDSGYLTGQTFLSGGGSYALLGPGLERAEEVAGERATDLYELIDEANAVPLADDQGNTFTTDKGDRIVYPVDPWEPHPANPLEIDRDRIETQGTTNLVRRLESYPNELADMALAIAATIQEELLRLEENKPNDPDALVKWEDQYDFLRDVEAQLRRLHISLIDAANKSGEVIERFAYSASIVSGLRSAFSRWISGRQDELIDGGTRLALIGLGTGFLQLCGAPVHESVIVTSALLGGPKVAEIITDTAKKIKDS